MVDVKKRQIPYLERVKQRKKIDHEQSLMPRQMKFNPRLSRKACLERLAVTPLSSESIDLLLPDNEADYAIYQNNIENLIGFARIPIGLAGPLRIEGSHAQGEFYVPMATTEGALVASYTRGAQVMTAAGGCKAVLISEGVTRTPCFAFTSAVDGVKFYHWVLEQHARLKELAEQTTRHGKLVSVDGHLCGNLVYLIFEYTTGLAAGQNMVTVATEAIFEYLKTHSPIKPWYHQLEGNLSSDKKASLYVLQRVRGKKVTAEVRISSEILKKYLFTTPKDIVRMWRTTAIGSAIAGYQGMQAHYANALAAIYIACGQDVACVAESANGISIFEELPDGALYASATLPNLIVGTVGGGTRLPTQRIGLDMLGLLDHEFGAQALAEIVAATCLAGELSLSAAMCAEHFSKAHKRLGRMRKQHV